MLGPSFLFSLKSLLFISSSSPHKQHHKKTSSSSHFHDLVIPPLDLKNTFTKKGREVDDPSSFLIIIIIVILNQDASYSYLVTSWMAWAR